MILDRLRTGALVGARTLDLSGQGLTEVPRDVLDLADTLEVLDLSRNALTSLPPDFSRLTKLCVLFGSGNPFVRLPPVLGACGALSQVGFRGCGLAEVPGAALPPALRWLTLTDNAIATLPPEIGERPLLQKLMLAGNRLKALPETLAGAPNLELLRLSANAFEQIPAWVTTLPRLAWLAWSGNPFDTRPIEIPSTAVRWTDLQVGLLLGEGASGRIYKAIWHPAGAQAPRDVAVKLYKGTMTSDGLPSSEMAACLAVGDHPHVVGGLGRLTGHPDGLDGLLMPLLPAGARALADPPSLATCSRDVYATDQSFDIVVALRIARDIGHAAAHLHARGLSHGDLYAHNVLWDPTGGAALLSDFGAASVMPPQQRAGLERLDVLAWGLLLGELLDRSTSDDASARQVQTACLDENPTRRPTMAEAVAMLDAISDA